MFNISKFKMFKRHTTFQKNICFSKKNIINIAHFQITRPGFHFGEPKKHDVATKLISYERYGKILFQKVAPGYLLHFAQDGSSKNALKESCSATFIKI